MSNSDVTFQTCHRLRKRKHGNNEPMAGQTTQTSENSCDEVDDDPSEDIYSPRPPRKYRKRGKRKREEISLVAIEVPRHSEKCIIHLDDSRSEAPKIIGAGSLKKLNDMLFILKPLSLEELDLVAPQAKVIRNKLQAVECLLLNQNEVSALQACTSCLTKAKKNFGRYAQKIKELSERTATNNEQPLPAESIPIKQIELRKKKTAPKRPKQKRKVYLGKYRLNSPRKSKKKCLQSMISTPSPEAAKFKGSSCTITSPKVSANLCEDKIDISTPTTLLKSRKSVSMSTTSRKVSASKRLLPKDLCFICNNWRVYLNKNYHTKLRKVESEDRAFENNMNASAKRKNDSEMLAKLVTYDVIAREGMYHKACYDNYRGRKGRSNDSIVTDNLDTVRSTTVIDYLKEYVDVHVFGKSEIVPIYTLNHVYNKSLDDHNVNIENEASKEKWKVNKDIKKRLLELYGTNLGFETHPTDGDICFDSSLSKGKLALKIYHHRKNPKEIIREAGSLAREEIKSMFKKVLPPKYPPRIDDLVRYEVPKDSMLIHLNSHIIAGKDYEQASARKKRRISSVSEDHAYSITNGRYKTPKQTSVAVSIRQHTRSKKIITLLNKLGHCISNDEVLSLETDWAISMRGMEHQVPRGVVKDAVVAQGTDNFDMRQYTETGEGTDHITQSLVVQMIPVDGHFEPQEIPAISKTKHRSLPASETHKVSFSLEKKQASSYTIERASVVPCSLASNSNQLDQFICELAAFNSSGSDDFLAPSYPGWTALQFKHLFENMRVVIGYYPPYLKPITDAASVDAMLKSFKRCAEYAGQKYTIVFADMDVVIRAQKILWMKKQFYENKVIVVPGMMHTEMDILGAVGIMVNGSGFNDILMAAKVIKGNSLKGVLSGRNIARSRECHRVFKTALMRQLLRFWIENLDLDEDAEVFQAIYETKVILRRFSVTELNKSNLKPEFSELHSNESLQLIFQSFQKFKEKVRREKIAGETGEFWLNYIDIINEIEMLRRSVHLHDRYLLLRCLQNLSFLFFMYNKHNYARWITRYIFEQLNVDVLWPGARELLDKCGISCKRKSSSPLLTANDMLLEATINNESGRGQGCNFRGFGNIDGSSERIHMTRSFRVEMNDWLDDFVAIGDHPSKSTIIHEEEKPRKIRRRERKIKIVQELLNEISPVFCFSNPPELFCLSTGAPVSRDAAESLLKCSIQDNTKFTEHYNAVYVTREKDFYEPIKQNSYKTFAVKGKAKKVSGKKSEQALKDQRNVLGAISLLAQQEGLSMETLLEFPFTETPPQISTAEGIPLKNCKSSIVAHLTKDVNLRFHFDPVESGLIVDAQYFIHLQAKELTSQKSTLKTYSDVCQHIFTQLMLLGAFPVIYFVTETYVDNSIKRFERKDRGSKTFLIGTVGLSSVRPIGNTWNAAMNCVKFKTVLQEMILQYFQLPQHVPFLKGRKLYYTLDNKCFLLKATENNTIDCQVIPELYCDHEEPDTKVLFYASKMPHPLKVAVLKISDTDVFINAIHHTPSIRPELVMLWGTKDTRKIFSLREVRRKIGEDMANALLGIYIFTGNGKVSAISGIGKVNPYKKVEKSEMLKSIFTNLGKEGKPSTECLLEIEEATCLLYGQNKTSINKARFDKFNDVFKLKVTKDGKPKVKGQDEGRIPMPLCVLIPHVQRAAREAFIQRSALEPTPTLPPLFECGYRYNTDKELEIKWVIGSAFPSCLQVKEYTPSNEEDDTDIDSDASTSSSNDSDGSDI